MEYIIRRASFPVQHDHAPIANARSVVFGNIKGETVRVWIKAIDDLNGFVLNVEDIILHKTKAEHYTFFEKLSDEDAEWLVQHYPLTLVIYDDYVE